MFQLTLPLLWYILLFMYPIPSISTRVSLTDSPSYSSMRPCVRNCFGNSDTNWLAVQLNCQNTNECVCRPDIQPSAVNSIKTCAAIYCSKNELDISSAVAVYNVYCTGAGFKKEEVKVVATTTSDAARPLSSSPITVANAISTEAPRTTLLASTSKTEKVPAATVSTTSNDQNDPTTQSRPAISTDTIAIIVAVIGTFFTAIGAYFGWRAYSSHRSGKRS